MGSQWLRVDFNIVFYLFAESAKFLDGVVRVSSSVARRLTRVSKAVRVWIVIVRLRTCDTDPRGHGWWWWSFEGRTLTCQIQTWRTLR